MFWLAYLYVWQAMGSEVFHPLMKNDT